jgi:hypothetical protein
VPDHRTGAYVESVSADGRRKTISVVIQGPSNTVMISPSEGAVIIVMGLGFQNDAVFLSAKRLFSDRLYEVSLDLDKQIIRNKAKLDGFSGEDYEQAVRDLLTLSEGDRALALYDLKQIGAGLRQKLNPELVKALTSLGAMKQIPEKEPAITFQNLQQVPVLWDMMYEEAAPQEDPDWEHFWGFKLPLTHWDAMLHPPNRIKLKRGLFSAIDQKLSFATGEVSLLVQQMSGGLCHSSLCDELKLRALDSLRSRIEGAPDDWLKQQGSESWFSQFILEISRGIDDNNLITVNTRKWKDKAVHAIFSDPNFTYELIHFACHCEPHEVSELLTQLKLHIAGEDISLTVASMPSERRPDQPGPLVFLNACGTGQQGASAEPPGFPENWISKREAVAVVATLCPVPDLFAHAFARKFYQHLFKSLDDPSGPVRERYLSEALLETRRYFMEECGNPLGLAYVLYAVKDACIEPRL